MDPGYTFLLLVGLAFVLGGIAAFSRKSAPRKWFFGALSFVTVVNLLQAVAISWTFRDGMGPDAIASTGREAFRRAFADFWFPLLLVCAPVILSAAISRFRAHERTA